MIVDEQDGAAGDEGAAKDGAAGGEGAAKNGAGAEGAAAGKAGEAGAGKGETGDKSAGEGKGAGTIASGADDVGDKGEGDGKDKAAAPFWNDKWREKVAEHIAAGDKKAYDKELKRLQRITDPAGIYGMYRELEGKFTGGGLVKLPGKDAKPEEIAAYHKAIGVPEKPEDYLRGVKLANGAVIGEADKPMVDGFVGALHKAGAPPSAVNAALNWYYQQQEDAAAKMDEADDTFRRESEAALKEELGPSFKRKTAAIASLFATAPGGADIKNANGLYARLMGGRTADGKLIGNDPDIIRLLVNLVSDVNPEATVVEAGAPGALSMDAEIAQIEKVMRENRREYNQKHEKRYLELLTAREKRQARQSQRT